MPQVANGAPLSAFKPALVPRKAWANMFRSASLCNWTTMTKRVSNSFSMMGKKIKSSKKLKHSGSATTFWRSVRSTSGKSLQMPRKPERNSHNLRLTLWWRRSLKLSGRRTFACAKFSRCASIYKSYTRKKSFRSIVTFSLTTAARSGSFTHQTFSSDNKWSLPSKESKKRKSWNSNRPSSRKKRSYAS